jgi:hypothetical protein
MWDLIRAGRELAARAFNGPLRARPGVRRRLRRPRCRDPAGPCGTTFNFSNALSITGE